MKFVLVSYGRPAAAVAAPGEWIATYRWVRPSQLDVVDCEGPERAVEIASSMLDDDRRAVEVRALMGDSGAEM